jgi:N-acetyl-anhydromuramyl-L-alanine amidase AmpD
MMRNIAYRPAVAFEALSEHEKRNLERMRIARKNRTEILNLTNIRGTIVAGSLVTDPNRGMVSFTHAGLAAKSADPIDDDWFAWLSPLAFDHIANEVLGHSLVTICGEGGWCVGDAADNRYPPITEQTHSDYTVQSFDVFRTGILPNGEKLPDWWFAVTPWLLVSVQVGGDSAFEQNAWYSDWHPDRAAIEAVKAMPVSARQRQGGNVVPNQLTAAKEQWFDSPNYSVGRTQPLDLIIIHSTRGGAAIGVEAQATVNWFMSPTSQTSAHAMITQDGRLVHFVADGDTAWGAGSLNPRALQVELEQPDNDTPFTVVQMAKLAEVLLWWGSQHDIPLDPDHVKGHEDLTPGKSDPGKMFDWPTLWAMLGYTTPREQLVGEILADLDNIKAKVARLK